MKIISHRGNIRGPVTDKENRPSYIDCALGLGFDVEVDLRFVDNKFWLGHDEPQYRIESSWIETRKNNLWFHCKDVQSCIALMQLNIPTMYFCHTSDPYVLTSNGYVWVHDLSGHIDDRCIIPLLSADDIKTYSNLSPYAVCTDYTNLLT
jgi:hypothetical protein